MTQQWREATPLIQPALAHPAGAPTTHSWRQYARCLGADPDIFYPVVGRRGRGGQGDLRRVPRARAVPGVRVTAREKEGVWGGRTEKERRRLIRQRRKTA